ncbi:MAG: cbb3-type cytochrome c oxidase subunit I [Magnetococcales bacterium]|nr:cbb3-type cytochrome c oxidase subunit I [Magnetococcales bacterium]
MTNAAPAASPTTSPSHSFALSAAAPAARVLARGWLHLALAALVGSGLVVLLVVLARAPGIHEILPFIASFRTALVIHVDLTVLVWFLACAGLLTALTLKEGTGISLGRIALGLAWAGGAILAFSPFLAPGVPHMNNYVPVLANAPFLVGLLIFAAGTTLMALAGLFFAPLPFNAAPGEIVLRLGIKSALLILLVATAMVFWTWSLIPPSVEIGEYYFELLFWGGGHVLQFTHTQLVMVAWLWLASRVAGGVSLSPRVAALLLLLGAAPAFAGPVIHEMLPVNSIDNRHAFTALMLWGAAISPLIVGLATLLAALRGGRESVIQPLRLSLLASLLLFGVGGVIGYLIQGINVTIPAHYHGSIVSVTLAYMGIIYLLLPQLGASPVAGKWPIWQSLLYGGGTLIHILGLAAAGGHDVQRKTAGAAQGLSGASETAMRIGQSGALLAVLAGVIFLVLVYRALGRKNALPPPA